MPRDPTNFDGSGPSPRGPHDTGSSGPKDLPVSGPVPSLARDLSRAEDLNAIFRVVRLAVRHTLGRERAGLGLAMSNLPPGLGAYWQVTGNLIVMNEGLLVTMRRMASSSLEYNAFVFVILAHEYLHALGFWGEGPVRKETADVARAVFGPDHPATAMAEGDLWQRFPFLRFSPGGNGQRLRMVRGFDSESTSSYIR